MGLTVIDHIDKAHFLSINKTRAYIDTKIPSLEEIISNLPAVKEDTIMEKRLTMVKDKYKGHIFDWSKVRIELFVMVTKLTDVYIPIKWLEQKVDRQNMMWGSFVGGSREDTCVLPKYQAKTFMFRGNCFVVTILSHNITITWLGIIQRIIPKAEDS